MVLQPLSRRAALKVWLKTANSHLAFEGIAPSKPLVLPYLSGCSKTPTTTGDLGVNSRRQRSEVARKLIQYQSGEVIHSCSFGIYALREFGMGVAEELNSAEGSSISTDELKHKAFRTTYWQASVPPVQLSSEDFVNERCGSDRIAQATLVYGRLRSGINYFCLLYS